MKDDRITLTTHVIEKESGATIEVLFQGQQLRQAMRRMTDYLVSEIAHGRLSPVTDFQQAQA